MVLSGKFLTPRVTKRLKSQCGSGLIKLVNEFQPILTQEKEPNTDQHIDNNSDNDNDCSNKHNIINEQQ